MAASPNTSLSSHLIRLIRGTSNNRVMSVGTYTSRGLALFSVQFSMYSPIMDEFLLYKTGTLRKVDQKYVINARYLFTAVGFPPSVSVYKRQRSVIYTRRNSADHTTYKTESKTHKTTKQK